MNPLKNYSAKLLLAGFACGALLTFRVVAAPDSAAESLGWKLGVQAYTFRMISMFEAIDKAHELGLKYIEMYPGQTLKPGSKAKTGVDMSDAEVEEMQAKLKEAGVKLVSFGVAGIPTEEAAARKHFEWAKKLGIEVLVTETTPNAVLDKLSAEFNIKVSLHNHPTTWPPEKVLAACKGLNPLVGSCADVGHWKRAGLNPVDTLKLVGDRVIHSHFKDLAPQQTDPSKPSKNLEDVPWGTGQSDAHGMLAQLKSQGYKGYFIIEYEHGSAAELMQNLPKCISFFHQTAAELAK